MNKLFLIITPLVLALSSCGDTPTYVTGANTGAAAGALADAHSSLGDALSKLKSDKPDVKGATKDIQAAQTAQKTAVSDLKTIQTQSDLQGKALAKSQKDEAYYKAIAENNVKILLVALFLGALVFWLSELGKNAEPYTALLPGVVAGMLGVMIFAVIACAVFELWGTISWLFHFL